jgi:hypothetical protein
MAIARKIDPAALARSFADEISAVPEVKRLWYWAGPHQHDPAQVDLDFYVLLDRSNDAADAAVADAAVRLAQKHPEVGFGLDTFLPYHMTTVGEEKMLPEGAIELVVRGD